MDLNTLHELGKSFEAILKLKTKPIGIKFFEKVEDVPAVYEWVNRKKVICNLCGFSRYYEIPVAITRENTSNLCVVADLSMGIGKNRSGNENAANEIRCYWYMSNCLFTCHSRCCSNLGKSYTNDGA